jgi:hypothetical protein
MAIGDGSKIIWHNQPNMYGRYFKCSKRTSAHLDWTKKQLAKKAEKDKKAYRLIIIQGCFNTGVSASAGTHDYDSCLDVKIEGMTWAAAQRFLRSCGWAAFWRKPSQGPWSDHVHMASLPKFMLQFVARVGIWVPGQIRDYYNHLNGLSSHAPDNTWHPKNIKETIFQYRAYIDMLSSRERLENLRKRMEIAVKENSKRTVENLRGLISDTKDRLSRLRKRLSR